MPFKRSADEKLAKGKLDMNIIDTYLLCGATTVGCSLAVCMLGMFGLVKFVCYDRCLVPFIGEITFYFLN